MKNDTLLEFHAPVASVDGAKTVLEELVRAGARRMLQEALEAEVEEFIAQVRSNRTYDSSPEGAPIAPAAAVRNGHLPSRRLVTGIGDLEVRQPRVRLRAQATNGNLEDSGGDFLPKKFTSQILPPYLRRLPSIDALIPALYLKGISTGDFGEALSAILGPQAMGLSAANIVRLKAVWEDEYKEWNQRDLSKKRYVYWWADGVHFNIRLEDERCCILVLMGALEDGRKEVVAILDGYRESKESWKELLAGLKRQGLVNTPKLAIGDGALGFWAALAEEFGEVRTQRCWVHKSANILDKMPKSTQVHAKGRIHDIYLASTKKEALTAYDEFMRLYGDKYPKACHCLEKDKEELLTFYDFPAAHWSHIRSTNPIESTFATVRLRTKRTKGCGSRVATLSMVFKLALAAEKKWRRINQPQILGKIIYGIRFVDGEEAGQQEIPDQNHTIAA